MLVLDCRMDESADKGHKKVFAVGAMIGHETQWKLLEEKWNSILKPHRIKYFRANDCAAMTGQFLKFRKNKHRVTRAERRIGETIRHSLLEAIVESRMVGLGMAIDMDDFRAVASTPEKLDAFGSTPYYHCYFLMMEQCANVLKKHMPECALAFGYDDHQEYGEHLRDVYKQFKKNQTSIARNMTTIAPFDDRAFVPVQVADLVASIVRKHTLWAIC